MIDALKQNFISQTNETNDSFPVPADFCEFCLGSAFWRAKENEPWSCIYCHPIPEPIRQSFFLTYRKGKIVSFGSRPSGDEQSLAARSSIPHQHQGPQHAPQQAQNSRGVVLIETLEIIAMRPVCSLCGCRWYIEEVFSDGSVKMKCWSCKEPTDGMVKEFKGKSAKESDD